MRDAKSRVQLALYVIFLVNWAAAAVLGLLMIWGLDPSELLCRVLASCIVVAVTAGYVMSATRLVAGPAPEEDRA